MSMVRSACAAAVVLPTASAAAGARTRFQLWHGLAGDLGQAMDDICGVSTAIVGNTDVRTGVDHAAAGGNAPPRKSGTMHDGRVLS